MKLSTSDSARSTVPDIKQINRSNIYALLRSGKSYTRQAIVVALGLSLPTVVQNLNEMVEEGIVEESGLQGKTGGRRAMTYSAVKDYRVAIGLDVTQHRVSAVAVDLCGTILGQIRIKQDFSKSDAYYMLLGSLISDLVNRANLDPAHVLGVGISIPALINESGTICYYCKVLDVDRLTCQEFAKFIPFQVRLCHDTSSSGFAEMWYSPPQSDFFYFMLSHSIGGSVFVNGCLYNGSNFRSCEIGHVQLVPDGRPCYCGGKGCTDAYCSAKPLVALTNGDLYQFFDLLVTGSAEAEAIWQNYLKYLAQAIHNIHMLYDCNIVLGGRIGERMECYIESLRAQLKEMDPFGGGGNYVSACNVKTESAASGAALSFIDEFISSI